MSGADFARLQREFAGHLRDPDHRPPPPGIEPRRMQVYRELIFNNIVGFIRNGFPVLCGLLGTARVERLVRDFIVRHRAETPYFLEIGREFLAYLHDEYRPEPDDPGYLPELAHYEWVELALEVAETAIPEAGIDPRGDLLHGVPVLSPLAWVLTYSYPVHRLGPSFQPAAPPPQPTHLVVHRNRAGEVKFLEINAVTARLLQLLRHDGGTALTGAQALQRIAAELRHPDPELVMAAGRDTLHELRTAEVILGSAAD
ncbi:MAG: DNA-binding domain-containing protein [Pseudomonadota bacterium]